jgi:hypothetical protein
MYVSNLIYYEQAMQTSQPQQQNPPVPTQAKPAATAEARLIVVVPSNVRADSFSGGITLYHLYGQQEERAHLQMRAHRCAWLFVLSQTDCAYFSAAVCMECGQALLAAGQPCPVCREPILDVVRIYKI